jgi:peroxiredoxin
MTRFFFLAVILLTLLLPLRPAYAQLHKGLSAPPFTLRNLEGKTFELKDYLGKYATIIWFTDFCDTCRAGFPQLASLWGQYEALGVRIVAVSTRGEANADVQKILAGQEIPFPILVDQQGEVTVKYAGNFIAGTCPVNNLFVIDRSGSVRLVRHFPGTPPEVLKEELKNCLSQ